MPDVPSALATALEGRYRIDRELGAGGMATVYRAEDLKHHRPVAIKVLKPALAEALGHERFVREVETTAALHHPHILPLYDSGHAGGRDQAGFLYYVMPLVEGESLRDRLDREKQLPLEDALQIAREVADALSYAHSRGVVHRDIKPENILLESGHAIVADFGVAKAVDAAGGKTLTGTGMSVGTPLYMSPEQAAGEPDLDGRSDLYALGCVLYEMLAGQPPFAGPTVESVIRQHLTAEPPSVSQLRPAVPAEIAGLLQRVLAKNAADRFSPAAAFVEALDAQARTAPVAVPPAPARAARRWVAPAVAAGVVAVALVGYVLVRGGGPEALDDRPSVVVLPFENLGQPEDEYFADGMTEELTSRLAQISGLGVTSRTTALQYKGQQQSLRDIGAELGVRFVLEGTVRTDRTPDGAGQVRVTPQLIRVADDTHLWSDRYTASLTPGEVFQVQADIAERVATALGVKLLGVEQSAVRRVLTTDQDAHDAYLKGRFHWNLRTAANLERAVQEFTRATDRDPAFAQAWAGLADALALLPTYGVTSIPRAEAYERAQAAARRALALDSTLAEAHASYAFARTYGVWDWTGAEAAFRRAIALDPEYPVARYWYAELLMALGRSQEAIAQAERGAALAPTMPIAQHLLGWTLAEAGDLDSAVVFARKALELNPDFTFSKQILAFQAAEERRYDDAARLMEAGGVPGPVARGWADVLEDPGSRAAAVRALSAFLRVSPPADPAIAGISFAMIGADDSAKVWLERGLTERTEGMVLSAWSPWYVPGLAGTPWHRDLLRRMGLRP